MSIIDKLMKDVALISIVADQRYTFSHDKHFKLTEQKFNQTKDAITLILRQSVTSTYFLIFL